MGKHRRVMFFRHTRLRTLVIAAAASTSFALGAASTASATTEPPTDTASAIGQRAAPPADGSAPADAAAFCEAAVAVEAAFGSEGEPAIGQAVEALFAATPEEIAPAVSELIALAECGNTDRPEFDERVSAVVDYMKANCGFTELTVALQRVRLRRAPRRGAGGPHDPDCGGDRRGGPRDLRASGQRRRHADRRGASSLPEDEFFTMVTLRRGRLADPSRPRRCLTPLDLTPGRYVASASSRRAPRRNSSSR